MTLLCTDTADGEMEKWRIANCTDGLKAWASSQIQQNIIERNCQTCIRLVAWNIYNIGIHKNMCKHLRGQT